MRFESPYLRFAGSDASDGEDIHGPYVRVISQRNQLSCRLLPEEFALARLFDGQRNAAQRLSTARQQLNAGLSGQDMLRFTLLLSDAGLLWAGADEPVPVPAQTDPEAQRISDLEHGPENDHALPPSTSPGSLAGAALSGPIAGTAMRARDEAEHIDWCFSPVPWLWLGRPFAALSRSLPGAIALALAALFNLLLLSRHDAAAMRDFRHLLDWNNLLFVGLLSSSLINLCTQAARAAAIHKATGEYPRFGIRLSLGVIPRFLCDTEGAVENLPRTQRQHILATGIVTPLLLFVLLSLGWLILQPQTHLLPASLLAASCFALGATLLHLNPLARNDGYYLLASRLGIADLREQAVLSLFNQQERWGNRQAPPRGKLLLYGLLNIAFVFSVVFLFLSGPARWLDARYGGAGVAILVSGLLLYVWQLRRQFGDRRGQIGALPLHSRLRQKAPELRRHWRALAVFSVAALWPYTFEPSGEFHVLPQQQAAISVELDGSITEILHTEGDWVEAGSLIARLDDSLLRSRLRRAEAEVARIAAELSAARKGATEDELALARQQQATARARLEAGQSEARRATRAHQRKAITEQDRDRAVAHAEVLAEELREAEKRLALIEAGPREENLAALEAALAAEQAEQAFVMQQIERSEVRAPIAGYLVAPELEQSRGLFVTAGQSLGRIEDSRRLQAEVLLPEHSAADITVGQPATLKAWLTPGHDYQGQVLRVAPSAESGRHGQVVRVLIQLDPGSNSLRSDLTGQAKIRVDTMPALLAFSRALLRFVQIEVWSWLP